MVVFNIPHPAGITIHPVCLCIWLTPGVFGILQGREKTKAKRDRQLLGAFCSCRSVVSGLVSLGRAEE